MTTTPSAETIDRTLARIQSVSASPNAATLDMLTRCLRSGDRDVRYTAIEKIAEVDQRAAELLHPLLLDVAPEVRVAAAAALGDIGDDKSVSELIGVLGDNEALVRLQAAESLGLLRAKAAIRPLTRLLDDPDQLVRGYAAEALGDIGDKRARTALAERLEIEGRNAARVRIVAGLYKLGQKELLPQLLRFLNIRSYRVRCAASNILDEVADASTHAEIIDALRVRFEKESTVAVRSTIESCIESIESTFSPEKPH